MNLASRARRRWKRSRRRLAGLGGYRPVLSDALQILRRRGQLTYAQEAEETYRPRIVVAEVLAAQDLDQLADEEVVTALRSLDYRPVAMTANSIFFADVRSAVSP